MGSPMVPLKHEFKKYSFKKTLKIYFLSRTLEIQTTFKQTSKKTSLDKSGLFLTREQFCTSTDSYHEKLQAIHDKISKFLITWARARGLKYPVCPFKKKPKMVNFQSFQKFKYYTKINFQQYFLSKLLSTYLFLTESCTGLIQKGIWAAGSIINLKANMPEDSFS